MSKGVVEINNPRMQCYQNNTCKGAGTLSTAAFSHTLFLLVIFPEHSLFILFFFACITYALIHVAELAQSCHETACSIRSIAV